ARLTSASTAESATTSSARRERHGTSDRHWRSLLRARDAANLRAWYRDHLGIDVEAAWGGCASSGASRVPRVDERIEDGPDGRFGWAADPEGNRFELWQPPAGR